MKAEGEMKLVLSGGGDDSFNLYTAIKVTKPFAVDFGVSVLCYCQTVRQAKELLALLRSLGAEIELSQSVITALGEVEK